MKKSSSTKTWIWIIVIIAVAGGAYFYFYGGSSPISGGLLQTQSGASSDAVGAQVLGLLNQIQSLQIDDSLFTDPGYETLQDYSVAIPPVDVGRPDPFAPLPGVVSASAATAATAPGTATSAGGAGH